METNTDIRTLFTRAVEVARPVIEGVRADQMTRPTPCDGMDVADLLAHIIMAVDRAGLVARTLDATAFTDPETGLAPAEWAPAFEAAASGAIDAWADEALLTTEMALPWMTGPGVDVLGIYLAELTIHTWDLAQATAQSVGWDDQAVTAATQAMHDQLPIAERTPMWDAMRQVVEIPAGWEAPFADAVEVGADASPIEALVAWCGRPIAA